MMPIFTILTLVAPATPATWYLVGDTPTALLAIDITSVHRTGQMAEVVEAQVFKQTLDTDFGPVRRIDQELLVNCQDHSITPQSIGIRKMSGEVALTAPPADKKPFASEAINSLVCLGTPRQPMTGPFHMETIMKTVGANP
jgi:hypothetical protein